jgi:hypothetical protein
MQEGVSSSKEWMKGQPSKNKKEWKKELRRKACWRPISASTQTTLKLRATTLMKQLASTTIMTGIMTNGSGANNLAKIMSSA